MGCDIHTFVEMKGDYFWDYVPNKKPFDDRNYGLFGFLAGVRNYSAIPVLSSPRGLPSDMSHFMQEETKEGTFYAYDGHNSSWYLLSELLNFDYDQKVEDRRYTRQIAPNLFDGGSTAEEGAGEITTYREFFGEFYFEDLEKLKELGNPENIRIIFFFDN